MNRETAVYKTRAAIAEFNTVCAELDKLDAYTTLLADEYLMAVMALTRTLAGTSSRTEWFDHRYDWLRGPQNWTGYERLVFGMQYIEEKDIVLDLCCGDGLFAGACAGLRAAIVHGVDRDAAVIAVANRLYARNNVGFYELDIVHDEFPFCWYNVITWFDGIEYVVDLDLVLKKIVATLGSNGILVGSTLQLTESRIVDGYPINGFNSITQLRT